MHIVRSAVVALLLLLVSGSITATVAPAAISPPLVESGPELDVETFAVAMSPAGERSALLYEGRVRASPRQERTLLRVRLGRGRTLAASQKLEDLRPGTGIRRNVRIDDVKLAVAPEGTAVAAWVATNASKDFGRSEYRLRVATARAGHRFGRPQTALLLAQSFSLEGLVAGRDGLTVLGLLRGHKVEVAVRRGAGRFSRRQAIGSSRSYVAPPTFALAPSGAVVAAWTPANATPAMASVLAPRARRFRPAVAVSTAGEATDYGRAVAGPGGAGVAWIVARTDDPAAPRRPRFARLHRTGVTFAAPVTIADVNASGGPHVAISRLGLATAWRHYGVHTEPGDSDSLTSSRVAANASWLADTTPRRLTEPPSLAARPVTAALGDRALIAWREIPQYDKRTPIRVAVAGPAGWLATVSVPRSRAEQTGRREHAAFGIDDDERPSRDDLAITAGRSGALLAYLIYVPSQDGNADRRLHVAGYRP